MKKLFSEHSSLYRPELDPISGSRPSPETKPTVLISRCYDGDGTRVPRRELVRVQTLTPQQVAERERLTQQVDGEKAVTDSLSWGLATARLARFDQETSRYFDVERLQEQARHNQFAFEQCEYLGIPVSK